MDSCSHSRSLFDEELLRELLDYEGNSEQIFTPSLSNTEQTERVLLVSTAAMSKHLTITHKASHFREKRELGGVIKINLEEAKGEKGENQHKRRQNDNISVGKSEKETKKAAIGEIKKKVAAIEESVAHVKSVLHTVMILNKQ